MDFCPICGKVGVGGGHVCTPKQVITSVPDHATCPDCGKDFPWNATHLCMARKGACVTTVPRDSVDVDTVNEMRVKALEQAVLLVMQQGGRDVVHDVAVYADSFFKFLMGESQ